jgi:chemotaxis signal transduction protein
MSSSSAWLLECGDALTVAVGDHEIVECVQPERYYSIPGTPDYCSSVLSWQGKLVPVMDMAAAIRDQRGLPLDSSFVCLLSYQRAPKQPLEYLALRISKTPQKIQVDDDQVCELPEGDAFDRLKSVAFCCFSHQQLPVPILDIVRLCSEEFRELAQAS